MKEDYSKWIDDYLGLEQGPEDHMITKAKKRYPEGCKAKCLYNGSRRIVTHKRIHIYNGNVWCDYMNDSNNFKLYDTPTGKWAEIVK